MADENSALDHMNKLYLICFTDYWKLQICFLYFWPNAALMSKRYFFEKNFFLLIPNFSTAVYVII